MPALASSATESRQRQPRTAFPSWRPPSPPADEGDRRTCYEVGQGQRAPSPQHVRTRISEHQRHPWLSDRRMGGGHRARFPEALARRVALLLLVLCALTLPETAWAHASLLR